MEEILYRSFVVAEEWVRGDVHTNGIEGAWALFKRLVLIVWPAQKILIRPSIT